MVSCTAFLALASLASAYNLLWDGRLNEYTTPKSFEDTLDSWSWSNRIGPYQYYIHGPGPSTQYVNLGPDYKNPADHGSSNGLKITIDSTSYWHNQSLRRTELIPQTPNPINKGKVYYHFSIAKTTTNPPDPHFEHQITFFESHFTELKFGLLPGDSGPTDSGLQWLVNGESKWSHSFEAGAWQNFAYDIDFAAGSVALWHSVFEHDLTLTVPAVPVNAYSDGADWHVGVLRVPLSEAGKSDGEADEISPEDWHFSGVYIESGVLTTSISGPE
ncbi:hypothetical protein EJ03DRAFT_299585 [Teratosphaeria nubilosa]|uniref:Glycoside hydrolase 131 catalytic N-terminal domain-containing protein n=1 Tax=Teratosphaeria nubilosa TaxID=161662 RepID=A0A6G1KYK3_9PEZI|nr:hypothetical protein EJ03DRAFT_299585 [Teratosphaeria nubilosa]